MNTEVKKKIEDEAFAYAKSLYTHAKDEDIKDCTQIDAYQAGAEFVYSLAEAEIERLKGLLMELLDVAHKQASCEKCISELQQFKTDNKL